MSYMPYKLLIALLFLSFGALAQNSTIYFDKDWKYTEDKSEMEFYREYELKGDDLYHIKDYYKSGQIQMDGDFIIKDKKALRGIDDGDIRTGAFVYYQFNGEKESEGSYVNDNRDGKWTEYYDTTGEVSFVGHYKEGDRHGLSTLYYKSGKVKSKVNYVDGRPDGLYTKYYENGEVEEKIKYVKGKRDGAYRIYYSTGKVKEERDYIMDSLIGNRKAYYPDGQLKLETEQKKGKLTIMSTCYDEAGEEIDCEEAFKGLDKVSEAYPYVEPMPMPEYNISKFLGKYTKYPAEAAKNNIEGRVYVKIIVDEDGNITDAKSISPNAHPLLQKEAVRVMSHLPPWVHGELNGVPVKVYLTLPLNFTLQDSKSKKKKK